MNSQNSPEQQPNPQNEQLTRFQAQLKLGLFAPCDYAFAVFLAVNVIGLAVLKLTGNLSIVQSLVIFSFMLLIMAAWIIVLCYRIFVRMLDIQADINLLPQAAARIAVGYFEGRKK